MRNQPWWSMVGLIVVASVCAEEPAPPKLDPPKEAPASKPAEMDEGAKKAFDSWEKLAYHLGRQGINKVSCKLHATLMSPTYPKPVGGDGLYTWDAARKDEQATLAWDNDAIGALLRIHGWSAQVLSDLYDTTYQRKSLEGAKLTTKEVGGVTVVKVEGDSPSGYREIDFDKNGLLTAVTLEVPSKEGEKLTQRTQFGYEKAGEQYMLTEQTSVLDLPGQGSIEMKSKFTFEKQGERFIRTKAGVQATMNDKPLGHSEITFSEYKFNDDAGK